MYIPSADMGEYDSYQHPQTSKPRPYASLDRQGSRGQMGSLDRQASRGQMGSLDRQASRGQMGSLERNPSKAKLGKTPRLPSGYFVLDGKVEGGKQTATAAASSNQGGLRRQQSFNSICSIHDGQDRQSPAPLGRQASKGNLGRQGSRGTLGRQPSRGQLRRQQSSSRMEDRDTYTSGKANWQDSLRGAPLKNVKSDWESGSQKKNSRSHSLHGRQQGNGSSADGNSRRLLEPGQARRSRSKSLTGRSQTRSPSPGARLLASTYSSRAKNSDAYQGSSTLPRRTSKSGRSPMRQQPTADFGRDTPDSARDVSHRSKSPGTNRRSPSPGKDGDDPFANYRSFEQFREKRNQSDKSEIRRDSYRTIPIQRENDSSRNGRSPPRNLSSPPRNFSSPPRNVTSPPKSSSTFSRPGSFSSFEPQQYAPRKTSNSSSGSGSGSGLYSDSGFGSSYNGSSAFSEKKSSYSSNNYSSFDSSSSFGRNTSTENSMSRSFLDSSKKYQEQKRSSSPVKISLGALKLATIQPWEDTKGNDNDYGDRRSNFSSRGSGIFS